MCETIEHPDGGRVIICGTRARGDGKFCACGRPALFLCDWKVAAHESGTCDKPICAFHSQQVAPAKHLCPEHHEPWEEWKRKHPPAQKSLFGEAA